MKIKYRRTPKLIVLSVLATFFTMSAYGSILGQGREGGHAVWCEQDGDLFPVANYYTLDYLAVSSLSDIQYFGSELAQLEAIVAKLLRALFYRGVGLGRRILPYGRGLGLALFNIL